MSTIEELVERAFDDSPGNPIARTHALAVVQHGERVFERYAPEFDADSTFISWSMAKSMTSALCGVMVDRGEIDIEAPAAVPEWQGDGDPRHAITLRHLLEMRSGLEWNEDYVDGTVSDVIEMLASPDMAALAASKPLEHDPGTHFFYSSGTTNIISRILGSHLGGRDAMEAALQFELFGPAGMTNAIPKFDAAGTSWRSASCSATAGWRGTGEWSRRTGSTLRFVSTRSTKNPARATAISGGWFVTSTVRMRATDTRVSGSRSYLRWI
jgi:CubicO group peptidase (beta-lactamase class C family)